ncbi:MAG: LysR substrate-binding domain-containing protein [Pseudomonadota bacterium]
MVGPTAKVSLRGLRTFCIAARYKSFRAAAEQLFVTSSAISHQIKAIEEELGVTLFDRSGRDLQLTDIGQSLYDDVYPLIEEVDGVVSRYKSAAGRSQIRISVQPFFASEYFIPRLGAFTDAHPEIDIQVGSSDESSEKHPADADLSVRLFRSAPSNLPSRRLFPLRMVPAGSVAFADAIKRKGKQITSDFPIIVHETLPRAWNQWSESSGILLPASPKVTRLDSMIAVIRAAQRGIGAALVPVPMGDLWFDEGSVVRLFEQELVTDAAYYLVWKEGATDKPSVRLLCEWIEQTFAVDS